MKTCTKCKIEKDFSEFHRRSNVSDGLRSHCKVCDLEYSKKRWQKEKIKKQAKAKTKVISGYQPTYEIGDSARLWEDRIWSTPIEFGRDEL